MPVDQRQTGFNAGLAIWFNALPQLFEKVAAILARPKTGVVRILFACS